MSVAARRAWIGAVVVCGLIAVGARAADAPLGDLLARLAAEDEAARVAAIDEIALLGAGAAGGVEALAGLLEDPSATVRAHAAWALGRIGETAKPAGPALVKLLGDPDQAVRRQAVAALGAIRPGEDVTLPAFVELMRDADSGVRLRVMRLIADAGADAVPVLTKALQDDQACYWACLVLRAMGSDAKAAVPALTELLADGATEVRREALLALAAIGAPAAPAASEIVPLLNDEGLRVPAAYALGAIGTASDEALAFLRTHAQSDDAMLSTVSTWALARLAPDDMDLRRSATEKLALALKSEDPLVRVAAARALAALPPAPEVTLPILEKALADADPATLHLAIDALASLGPAALPQIEAALKVPGVREAALQLLTRFGPEAAPASLSLAALLADEDARVAADAAMALAAIGPGAAAAVPALTLALERTEGGVAADAAYALGQIGPDAAAAGDALAKAMESGDAENPNPTLKLMAAWALTRVAPADINAARVVPALTAGLQADAPMLRLAAAEALGSLGPLAAEALEALETAARDSDARVQTAAANAIKLIQVMPDAAATETPATAAETPPAMTDTPAAATSEPAQAPAAMPAAIEVGSTVWVVKDAIPLRAGEEIIGQLPLGAELKVLDVKGSWLGVRVDVEGLPKSGWVHRSHVGAAKP